MLRMMWRVSLGVGVLAGAVVCAASSAATSRTQGLIALSRCRPDGCGQGTDLWVMRQDSSSLRRLTRDRAHNDAPSWSPDGKRLVFVSGATDSSQIWIIDADGTHLERLTPGPALDEQPAWSPDGKQIVFVRALSPTAQGLVVFDLRTHTERLLEARPGTYRHPTWSPDGRRIAFSYVRHAQTGRYAIFEVGVDGKGLQRVSRNPHDDYWDPAWSPDARTIAFTLVYREGKGYRADLDLMRADGRRQRTVARAPAGWAYFSPSWSPDGSDLVFVELHASAGMGVISYVRPDGSRLKTLPQLLSDNRTPAWQP
jgi:Tol biopolymer transport system component